MGAAAPQIPWLNSLSTADPFFILPIFMGVVLAFSWRITKRLNPSYDSKAKESW
jgi:membrane protein insertase Oxa1/YidC/SpoIIIJ